MVCYYNGVKGKSLRQTKSTDKNVLDERRHKMETIIENGKKIDGIPYPVSVWDAKNGMWDDSIEELSAIFANSEGEAIDLAKDYMLEGVYASDMDGEEQAEAIEYYSNDGNYIIDSDRHEMRLYVFEEYTDKGGA